MNQDNKENSNTTLVHTQTHTLPTSHTLPTQNSMEEGEKMPSWSDFLKQMEEEGESPAPEADIDSRIKKRRVKKKVKASSPPPFSPSHFC